MLSTNSFKATNCSKIVKHFGAGILESHKYIICNNALKETYRVTCLIRKTDLFLGGVRDNFPDKMFELRSKDYIRS